MTTEVKCPKCGIGLPHIYVQKVAVFNVVCRQGRGFEFDTMSPIVPLILDECDTAECRKCGHEGSWKSFMHTVDEEENTHNYHNFYRCPCGEDWNNHWSCMCNDRCPKCNKEIEPYESHDDEGIDRMVEDAKCDQQETAEDPDRIAERTC